MCFSACGEWTKIVTSSDEKGALTNGVPSKILLIHSLIRSSKIMQRPIWRLGAALVVALGIVAACGGGDKPPPAEPELLLSANPRQINSSGQASQIEISGTNADGTAGTGP